jgi:hypothetical protein
MDIQFACGENADLTLLEKRFPDLEHDYDEEGTSYYFIGKSGDAYYDEKTGGYNYGDDENPDWSDERVFEKEHMSRDEAAYFCGFSETIIPGSDTMIEGNGGWAQNQLRKSAEYLRGCADAKSITNK